MNAVLRWVLVAVMLAMPAAASAQQARPLSGIPIQMPQIRAGQGGITIVAGPGVLPAVRIPLDGVPRGRARPRVPAPEPVAPAPVEPPPFALPELPAEAPEAPELPEVPTGAGRTYGVFVGISDYASASDLPYCADDAARVQRAFVDAGVTSPLDTVVLQDHRATRAAVAGAVERFARRMGPDDTLVFFFSGHGNQVADQDGDEADGQDETILLADGPVTDDELAALLAGGQGRDVVALDSCYSGGFQQDLARLPDTAGLYASREDQVSYVASEHQAGGYLSYHLAEAVRARSGRPVTMGELASAVSDGFDRDGATDRQQLTIGVSRSVSYRTVVFAPDAELPARVAMR